MLLLLSFVFCGGRINKNVNRTLRESSKTVSWTKWAIRDIGALKNLFAEVYLEPSRTSTMELFCENINSKKP